MIVQANTPGLTTLFCALLLLAGCLTESAAPSAPTPPPQDPQPPKEALAPAPHPEPQQEPSVPPGAPAYGDALIKELKAALDAKDDAYQPRTHHFNDDKTPKFTNRLIKENSPYLLQHAHNPVDWRPWGDEAFEEAKKLGRPVLLSVGYATCHWCHVMERESFEDLEIAQYINTHYIAIKVDRERRPDVDSIYMNAVRLLSRGNGGWPMTVIMNPARQPFFAGTYFPARDGDRGTRKGFFTILKELHEGHTKDPEEMTRTAIATTARIQQMVAPARPDSIPGAQAIDAGAARLASSFDGVNGGFGRRPKFPRPVTLLFLMRHHRRTGNAQALEHVAFTLQKMAAGGIRDHVGGGFHRYSVDSKWLVPHFEKMLYDNAQLSMAYLEAHQLTNRADFLEVARQTLDYVIREMTAPEGVFYSATDADSLAPNGHQEEGYFFTWTPAELDAVLTPQQSKAIKAYYGVTARGNFEGRNIFHTVRSIADAAKANGVDEAAFAKDLADARKVLYTIRGKRPAPLTDDKALVAWNGLMISAFARAGLQLQDERYTKVAIKAADFIHTRMFKPGQGLSRVYKSGQISHRGVLDDYAFYIAALLDLHEATGQRQWLDRALAVQKTLDAAFWDSKDGGYFMAHKDTPDLMVREKPDYDGAVPSGNSMAALNLLRLHQWTDQERFGQMAQKLLGAFGRALSSRITALPLMGSALDYYLDKPLQIVVVKPNAETSAAPILKALGQRFVPNRVLTVVSQGQELDDLAKVVPLVEGKVAQNGKVTAYVCQERVCQRPTSNVKVFEKQLGRC